MSLCSGTEILLFIKHLLVHADMSSVLHSSNASEFFELVQDNEVSSGV